MFVDELRRAERDGVSTARPEPKTPSGDDRERLRGLPAIGPNVAGHIRDTQPERALLTKEARRERRR